MSLILAYHIRIGNCLNMALSTDYIQTSNFYRYICVYDPELDKFLDIVDVAGQPPSWEDEPFIFSEADIYGYIENGVNKFSRNPKSLLVIPCYRLSVSYTDYELDWSNAVKLIGGFL